MADAAAEDEGGEENEEEVFHIGPLMFGVRLSDLHSRSAFVREQYVGNGWQDVSSCVHAPKQRHFDALRGLGGTAYSPAVAQKATGFGDPKNEPSIIQRA